MEDEKKLMLVYSQVDILQAQNNKGMSAIVDTYNSIKQVALKYNSEHSDKVKISSLSEPYKEFWNYKENVHKKDFKKFYENMKGVIEGDYFFRYRATYEISFYDEYDCYEDLIPKGSPYWHWFREYYFKYCEENNKWFTDADICNKPFDWQYRNQVRAILVSELRPIGESYLDYEDKVQESDIDERILKLEQDFEKKKLEVKKSWE